MTATPDLSVREYAPSDRTFLQWTLRTTARRALQHDALRADTPLDRRIEQATELIDRRSRDHRWVVLVASFRGERCGVLIAPPYGRLSGAELAVPGLAVSRSGARVYVDPWYAEVGAEQALDEAADLARQAAGLTPSDAPRSPADRSHVANPGATAVSA